jgi:hypothetical protein
MKRSPILLIVSFVLTACSGIASLNATSRPAEGLIPTPVSSLVGTFIWQTDGLFGYRVPRPASWESMKPLDGRYYGTPGFQDRTGRLVLRVINLQAYYHSGANVHGVNAQLALFEKDSSLEGWTKGIERIWKSNGLGFTLLRALPEAKVYMVKTAGYANLELVAFAVDQKQPLAMELTASGVYADMERLQTEGVLDDFATMVASIQAIPQDPQNVSPSLR